MKKVFRERPALGRFFFHQGARYQVSAIYENGVVGTLVSVTGEPRKWTDITTVPMILSEVR